jgi:hypothetical protein
MSVMPGTSTFLPVSVSPKQTSVDRVGFDKTTAHAALIKFGVVRLRLKMFWDIFVMVDKVLVSR